MTMEEEIGLMLPQADGLQKPPEAGRSKEGSALRASGGSADAVMSDFRPPELGDTFLLLQATQFLSFYIDHP